jgi:flagellar motor protein MotB
MYRRTNPWPAFADLFSALLIATFAGFIMLAGAYQQELGRYQQAEKETTKMRKEADRMVEQIQSRLGEDNLLGSRVRRCGEDTCIDLDLHFKTNDDILADPNESDALGKTCQVLRDAIDQLPDVQRKDIQLTIEGHTDNTQAQRVTDQRERYLFNWNLSSRRASSVSYVFHQCGLKTPEYQIVAIGYADSVPLPCVVPTDECNAKNRRTTLRLHADTRRIGERLKEIR